MANPTPTKPLAITYRQFTKADMDDPASLNEFALDLVTEITRLGGSLGVIIIKAPFDMSLKQVKNVADPTDAQDVVTKAYADAHYAPKV